MPCAATWLPSDTDLFIRYGALDQLAELIALYFGDSTSVSAQVASACVKSAGREMVYTHPVEDTVLLYTHTWVCISAIVLSMSDSF